MQILIPLWFRRKPKPPVLIRPHTLASRLVRNSGVVEETRDDGRVVLVLSLKPARWTRILGQSTEIPVLRKFELDELGHEVWDRCASSPTVEQLIRRFAADHQVNVREAEVSVVSFIQMLMKRGLVGVEAPDGSAASDDDPPAANQDSATV